MKRWAQVLIYKLASAEGKPITWEAAARLAAIVRAEQGQQRERPFKAIEK